MTDLGFPKETVAAFKETEVDGDLLLLLDERNLKEDLHIKNGIHRKRFLRELNNLKKSADYSSRDEHNVADFLSKNLSQDYRAFTYNFIKADLNPAFLRRLSEPDLQDMLLEAGVDSSIHRVKIIEAIYDQRDDEVDGGGGDDGLSSSPYRGGGSPASSAGGAACEGNIDVYVSFDKSKSAELASLIEMQLTMRGMTVCTADVRGGKDTHALERVGQAGSFVIVLSGRALDACIGDERKRNPLHREIAAALESDCNVIPVIDNFQVGKNKLRI